MIDHLVLLTLIAFGFLSGWLSLAILVAFRQQWPKDQIWPMCVATGFMIAMIAKIAIGLW